MNRRILITLIMGVIILVGAVLIISSIIKQFEMQPVDEAGLSHKPEESSLTEETSAALQQDIVQELNKESEMPVDTAEELLQ